MDDEPKTSPSDQIAMVHPDLPDTEPVATTRRQLDQVWSKQGWTEHTGDAVTDTAATAEAEQPATTPKRAKSTTNTAATATKEG